MYHSETFTFINRKQELRLFSEYLSSDVTQVISLVGDGGLGKTRLLQELRKQLVSNSVRSFHFVPVIDFDDLEFHYSNSIAFHIIDSLEGLKDNLKKEVQNELSDLIIQQQENRGALIINRQRERVINSLSNALNDYSRRVGPVVLQFDTVEKMPCRIQKHLLLLANRLEGPHLIFSGRPNTGDVHYNRKGGPIFDWQLLSTMSRTYNCPQTILLEPLEMPARKEYLEAKETQSNIKLSTEQVDKILSLSDGKPILLDLATYFFALSNVNAVLNHNGTNFEEVLIRRIVFHRRAFERLILVLSRVYPLSEDMLATMLNVSSEAAAKLFAKARSMIYIKTLRDKEGHESITLHDEMRSLVHKYIWKELDSSYRRRKSMSHVAEQMYYKLYDEANSELLHSIERFEEERKEKPNSLPEMAIKIKEALIDIDVASHKREILGLNWIKNALYNDFDSGFETWRKAIEEVRAGRIGKERSFAAKITRLAQPYFSDNDRDIAFPNVRTSSDQKFEYSFVSLRSKLDMGDFDGQYAGIKEMVYEEVRNGYEQLLENNMHDSNRVRRIHNMLGVLEKDQGRIEEAIKHQKEVLARLESSEYGARANVENQLGYLYQLYKDTDPQSVTIAESHYKSALENANLYLDQLKTNEFGNNQIMHTQSLIASIINNMGYLTGLMHNYSKAESQCKNAITLWKRIGRKREVGWAKINLGVLARDQRQYQQSEQRLNEAIDLLKLPDDFREWSQAYLQLGWTQWFMGSINGNDIQKLEYLESAKNSLLEAQRVADEHNFLWEQPDIHHQLASVYWYLWLVTNKNEYIGKARETNIQAISLCKKLNNVRYYVDALVGEMEFDYDLGKPDNIDFHLDLLEKVGLARYPFYAGRVERILGNWAYRQDNADKSFEHFAKALPLINQHGGYGPYAMEIELENISTILRNLHSRASSPDKIMEVLGILQEKWSLVKWVDVLVDKGGDVNLESISLAIENALIDGTLQIVNLALKDAIKYIMEMNLRWNLHPVNSTKPSQLNKPTDYIDLIGWVEGQRDIISVMRI